MKKQEVLKMRRTVMRYYRKHGRHDLPWRKTTDPYHILVSEIMLQQTQVARVMQKYQAFTQHFPSSCVLAQASLREVLSAWSGLGYNRRAKMLHEAGRTICHKYGGVVPKTYKDLMCLPGVGPYTANAVCTFAYNIPVPMIETNIRTVLLHHLHAGEVNVSDNILLKEVEQLLDKAHPREWYWALMDYGAYLKREGVKTNMQSNHYRKQTKFEGSDRQVRGAIVRVLAKDGNKTKKQLQVHLVHPVAQVEKQLDALVQEDVVRCKNGKYRV